MAELRARITLEDNVSTQITKPIDVINKLKESATNASEAINSMSKKKVDLDANSTINKIKSVKENVENITKKKFEVAINAIDKTKSVASKVKEELNALTKTPTTVAIKAKDETVAAMSKVKSELLNLKTLAATIVLGVVGKGTIGAASHLEQEQIAMKHFIGYNNQGKSTTDVQKMTDSYIGQLRTEANATPFSTNEVISAGRRAVNISTGDTKQAMDLVKLSENMAALNPGKSVMDAMEALADLKTGETERMKEFGFKISQDDIKKAGGTDNYFKTQTSDKGNIGKVFAGGANELSKTTAGQWSTVTGNLENIGANFGKAFLPVINKILTPLANLLDKNSDKFTKFGESIVKVGGTIGKALTPAFNAISKGIQQLTPAFSGIPKIINQYAVPAFNFFSKIAQQYILPALTSVSNLVKKYVPVITSTFSQFVTNVEPYLQRFWNIIQTYVIPIIQNLWSKVEAAMPGISSLFKTAFEVAAGAIKISIGIFEKVAPVISTMYKIISPVLDAVIWLFDKVASAIEKAVGWLSTWNGTKADDKTVTFTQTRVDNNRTMSEKQAERAGKNALGTSYWKGGLTWVGENGPELIELQKGAKVYNNRTSMNMINGMSNNRLPADFSKTGEDIPTSLAKGIKKTSNVAEDSITKMSEEVLKTFGTGIADNSKYVTKSTNYLSKNIHGIFTILGKQSNPLGKNISEGLGKGLQDSGNNVTDIVKTLTNKVIETFNIGFDIHSPSRVLYKIGTHVIQGFMNGVSSKDLKGFVDKHVKTAIKAFGTAVNVPGAVNEWLIAALQATGTPLSWLPGLQRLVMAESGGDPNNWNSQSVGGEHATGLLQTLPSTFQEFMQKSMNNILNPVDNAASAINYIKSRYGDVYNTPLFKGGSYVGYATGTDYALSGYHWVGEEGPELVKFNGGEKVLDHETSIKMLKKSVKPTQMQVFQNLVPVDIPPINDVVQTIKQSLRSVDIPKIKGVTQNINQRLIPTRIPSIDDMVQTIRQQLVSVDIPQIKDVMQTIKQSLISAKIPNILDMIQNVVQNLVPASVNQPKELIQNVKQRLSSVNVPEIADVFQSVKQRLIPVDTSDIKDSIQIIKQKLMPTSLPKIEDVRQNIRQQLTSVNIPKVKNIAQIIKQSLTSVDIPKVKDVIQKIIQKLIPVRGTFIEEEIQNIKQKLIPAKTSKIKDLEQNIKQVFVPSNMSKVKDVRQNILQTLVPTEVPKIKDYIQNIIQNLIPVNIPLVKNFTQSIKQNFIPTNIPKVEDIIQNVRQNLIPFKVPKINENSYNLKNEIEPLKFNTDKIPKLKSIDFNEKDKKETDKTTSKPFIINMYGTVIREEADIDKIATALAKQLKLAEMNM